MCPESSCSVSKTFEDCCKSHSGLRPGNGLPTGGPRSCSTLSGDRPATHKSFRQAISVYTKVCMRPFVSPAYVCLLTWQATEAFACQMHKCQRFTADYISYMHADLQALHMALVAALTVYHSSKTSSKMRLAPTSACLQKSCRDSGMKS